MSVALRLAESLPHYDDLHLNVECFVAVLLAPLAGRRVALHRAVTGEVYTASHVREM